jgi:nicotinamide mononucleotide transporter
MLNYLSVDNIAFTIIGYPMSYIEFIGTILYLWSVWLISRRNILTWPIGIASVLLYLALFYQIRLYSDALEQIYYLGASIYGWWVWNISPINNGQVTDLKYNNKTGLVLWVVATLLISAMTGFMMIRIHIFLPEIFPNAASFPYLDAFTTIMSFSAMWLMAQKKTESWIYWIIIDAIGIWLYYVKDLKFISLLYIALLFMAINGLRVWNKAVETNYSVTPKTSA